ncbi:bacteriochlorophyll 4-vinyl reductase [Falsiroseomonas selenitidurans]|uniref:Bacteriochlorophyll 4-vinyl reductase n=1 Tax=Falsiroseomonas selenitidurans TaxID=2716335 RepID=A0ABX1DXV6_9PROT|nr:bacteriochlorophyll 4-vinyl reductase [Falsiroseomonas selenitidurans]NKC29747.1 bacteriochlorophyll 4-vinyl reductase [Falsiroseomonas selenitidurans]
MHATGRIGPNAVLQLRAAIRAADGDAVLARVFAGADLLRHLEQPPGSMVAETEVAALFQALRREMGEDLACRRAAASGAGTARYLLSNRIPRPMRALLPHLPAVLAAPILTAAIRQHGWTFLGSGRLDVLGRRPLGIRIRLAACLADVAPVASAFYRTTFEALYRALVDARIQARPSAAGPADCAFDLDW